MITAGIDAGSRAIKVVLMNAESLDVIANGVMDQGFEQEKLAYALYTQLLDESNISNENVDRIIATGYGRNIISFADRTVTEITCHAVGVKHLVPDAMTVIDIGGQDSKLIHLYKTGKVRDFVMNDRCAAGTGRFLEVVAERLQLSLDDLGEIAAKSKNPAVISSMCVVFAETEIIGLLASGQPREDIVAGVQNAVANRLISMAGTHLEPLVVFTGGVAMISGMNKALQNAFRCEVTISPQPQMTGALGAAILASKQVIEQNLQTESEHI
jgi:predicted CoA-substrate-specific enzyme activase